MDISRQKIKNIGKNLRANKGNTQLSEQDLSTLSLWRDTHAPKLSYLLKLIQSLVKAQGLLPEEYSLAQRIKRIHSIRLKLNRFPNMQLSTMDDVAGARIILENTWQVDSLYQALKEKNFKHSLVKVNNYQAKPKPDGYRSIHLVYKTMGSTPVQIEVQIRTHLQHIWATAVEVFGTIIQTSFKTGDGEEEWRTFFKLLSSNLALKENTPLLNEHEHLPASKLKAKLVASIKELKIIEKLTAYTSAYHSTWDQNRKKGRMGKYAILTLDTITNTTKVEFFAEKNRLQGLRKYAELEQEYLENQAINFVFISVNNMNRLKEAYPNYFMDTKTLVKILSLIVLNEF